MRPTLEEWFATRDTKVLEELLEQYKWEEKYVNENHEQKIRLIEEELKKRES